MATLVIAEFSIKEQYVEQFKELLASSDGLEVTRSSMGASGWNLHKIRTILGDC